MRIEDEDLLSYYRYRPCDFCGRNPLDSGLLNEPHHIYCRGHGSGSRLDVPLNLLSACPGPTGCHEKHQEGRANREKCWWLIERLHGLEEGQAEAAIFKLLREPKRERA